MITKVKIIAVTPSLVTIMIGDDCINFAIIEDDYQMYFDKIDQYIPLTFNMIKDIMYAEYFCKMHVK